MISHVGVIGLVIILLYLPTISSWNGWILYSLGMEHVCQHVPNALHYSTPPNSNFTWSQSFIAPPSTGVFVMLIFRQLTATTGWEHNKNDRGNAPAAIARMHNKWCQITNDARYQAGPWMPQYASLASGAPFFPTSVMVEEKADLAKRQGVVAVTFYRGYLSDGKP